MLKQLSSLFRKGLTGREYQERLDTTTAAVFLTYRELVLANNPKEQSEKIDLFDQALVKVEPTSFTQQKNLNQNYINAQVMDLCKSLGDYTHSKKSISEFSVSVFPSSIDNAGKGVKLVGTVPCGTVVCFFPGTVYYPGQLKTTKHMEAINQSQNCRARFDGKIIDANTLYNENNPWAIGHMINHPPAKTPPNVMAYAYDFPKNDFFETEQYQKLIPNQFIETPSIFDTYGKKIIMNSIIFLTTRDIKDEELLLNYRYSPKNPYPSWYTPVNLEEDERLWSEEKSF